MTVPPARLDLSPAMLPIRNLFLLALLASLNAWSVAAPAPDRQPDAFGRETPRSSISNLLQTCHQGQFVRAAQYLDLSRVGNLRRATDGPELARRLCDFLDHDMEFEVENLDNTAEGSSNDDLSGDLDRLLSASVGGRKVALYLAREDRNGGQVWVVSADSVSRIPLLPVATVTSPLERYMPAPLVEHKLVGTAYWAWFGLALLGLALAVTSRLLSKIAVAIARPILRRYTPWVGSYRLRAFVDPLRLLLGVAVFRATMEVFAPSALLREFLLGACALLLVIAAASLLMRIVDVVSDHMIARLDPTQRSLAFSVFPLGVRFLKICIFGIAILVVLDKWGVQITTILAGVGVGGLAVALAAQKTIENLFGGISILTDRPVLVGDVCTFGGQTGTVTDIGLRSTRIRTSERTIVTIPNATFSAMTLENLTKRDRMLFKPALQLRRDTTPVQIRQLMDRLEQFLRSQEDVDATEVPVRFVTIAPESFRIEVFAYVLTTSPAQYLRRQTELLLQVLELTEKAGVRLAVPFTASVPAEMNV